MKSLNKVIYEHLKNNEAIVCVTIIEQSGSAPRTAGAKMIVKSDLSIVGTIGGGLYEAKAIKAAQNLFSEYASTSKDKDSIQPNLAHSDNAIKSNLAHSDNAIQANLAHSNIVSDDPNYTHKNIVSDDSNLVHSDNAIQPNLAHSDNAIKSCGAVFYKSLIVNFDLRGASFLNDMDMVCGGELRLLIEYIATNEDNIRLYEMAVKSENNSQSFAIITCLNAIASSQGQYSVSAIKSLYYLEIDNKIGYNEQNIPSEIKTCACKIKDQKAHCLNFELNEYVIESFNKPYILHIFGAGHVACELAKITHFLDFMTIVLDDRAEFSNAMRFPSATSLVLESLEQQSIEDYFKDKNIGSNDGIIIVTRGHARDREVLAATLKTSAGYVGMIGSKSKRKTTYDFLLKNGFTDECFAKIHSPIGLSIGAETPQEIAISIAAELIQWRATLCA